MSLKNTLMNCMIFFLLLTSNFVASVVGGEYQFPGKEDSKLINVFDFIK